MVDHHDRSLRHIIVPMPFKKKPSSRSDGKQRDGKSRDDKPRGFKQRDSKPTDGGAKPIFKLRKRKKPKIAHDFADAQRGERLQKVLATAGVASRRVCEQLIEEGAVKVNGEIVRSLPAWVDAEKDHIEVDGRPIARHRKSTGSVGKDGFVYVALHKPRDVFSTTRDEFGRETVTDMVQMPPLNPGDPPPRLYPVGRLDADATGLMLLTNDGDLAHRLTHPSYEVPKEYEVSVRGKVTDEDVDRIVAELKKVNRRIKGRKPEPGKLAEAGSAGEVRVLNFKRDEENGDRTSLLVKLNEGPDREVKWVLKRLGYTVRRVKRLAVGPIKIKGIAIRSWRMLTPAEVNQLRRAVGLGKSGEPSKAK